METLDSLKISKLELIDACPNIENLSDREIKEKIMILTRIGCNKRHTKNIIESNPNFLDRSTDDVLKLIKKLLDLGFTNIEILFDSNPYILNLDAYEIDNYVQEQLNAGISLEDIVDKLESEPYLFNEI